MSRILSMKGQGAILTHDEVGFLGDWQGSGMEKFGAVATQQDEPLASLNSAQGDAGLLDIGAERSGRTGDDHWQIRIERLNSKVPNGFGDESQLALPIVPAERDHARCRFYVPEQEIG